MVSRKRDYVHLTKLDEDLAPANHRISAQKYPKKDATINSDDSPQYQKPSVILEVIVPRVTTITICILEVIIADRNRTGPSVSVLTNMFHLARILE